MKNFLKENWFKIFVILIIGGLFYWHEIRPMHIRKECYNLAIKNPFNIFNSEAERRAELNFMYNNCLSMHGLEK